MLQCQTKRSRVVDYNLHSIVHGSTLTRCLFTGSHAAPMWKQSECRPQENIPPLWRSVVRPLSGRGRVFPSAAGSGYMLSIRFYRDRCDFRGLNLRSPVLTAVGLRGDWIALLRPPRIIAALGMALSPHSNAQHSSMDLFHMAINAF